METFIHDYFVLFARLLLATPFIHSALEDLSDYKGSSDLLKMRGVPLTLLILPITIAIKLLGGTFLIFGVFPEIAASILGFLTFISILGFHDFWNKTDPLERKTETYWFSTKIGLMGGLLMYIIR